MKSQVRRRQARGWLVAGLLLASCGWFAPSTSWAGCSHYVLTKADAARARTVDLEGFGSAGTLPRDPWRSAPLDDHPAAPCSGLRCSRDSSPPTTVPQALPRIDVWGCVAIAALALRPTSSPFPLDDASPRSRDRAERLARPPR